MDTLCLKRTECLAHTEYCSDGKIIDFIDDLAKAGADGFIFEPMNPLEPIVKKNMAKAMCLWVVSLTAAPLPLEQRNRFGLKLMPHCS